MNFRNRERRPIQAAVARDLAPVLVHDASAISQDVPIKAVFIVANVLSGLAGTIEQLTLFRIIQGIGACAGGTLMRAIVRDLYERAEAVRVMGLLASA